MQGGQYANKNIKQDNEAVDILTLVFQSLWMKELIISVQANQKIHGILLWQSGLTFILMAAFANEGNGTHKRFLHPKRIKHRFFSENSTPNSTISLEYFSKPIQDY